MIEVYREKNSAEADWVEAELREMVLGYERVITSPQRAAELFGQDVSLPVLRDGERFASGQDDLKKFLRELENFAAQWRMFEGDWCYIDEDGETC